MKISHVKFFYVIQLISIVLLSLMFLFAGTTKLLGLEMHITNFNNWGLPIWFMYLTGAVEVLSIILLNIQPTRFYGALLLIGTMIGAILIHVFALEYSLMGLPIFLLILSCYVSWFNKPSWVIELYDALPIHSKEKSFCE